MSQKDIGRAVVLSLEDAKKLHLNFDGLEHICDITTPTINGVFDDILKLKLYSIIQKTAKKENADVALIRSASNWPYLHITGLAYDFSLYKYK